MKKILAAMAALSLLGSGQPAFAWGSPGHQQVGAIAQQLLNPHATAELKTLLVGFGATDATGKPDLASAAVWADCARDVFKGASDFGYARTKFTPTACYQFKDTPEVPRMIDYAKRNWTQCVYSPGCHGAYHFADVALQHDDYEPGRTYVGTGDHDVVSAIQAALAVLQGAPCPPPFSIKDKKEAALLLAHFVGDIHQPLHVGAVYLTDAGQLLDPGLNPEDAADKLAETRGGNSLKFGKDNNLHSTWDGIPKGWGVTPNAAMMKRAREIAATGGALEDRPVAWATQTVSQAHKAYAGVTYSPVALNSEHKRYWVAQFADTTKYGRDRRTLQAEQIATAGARLAELYNAVWP
jgi:hypothetical protein